MERVNWRIRLSRLCCWVMATVFVAAALPKLADQDAFAATVGAWALLPSGLVGPTALAVPLLELGLSVGLLLRRRWSLYGSLLLMTGFILLLGYGIWMGYDIDCGCFGPEDPEKEAFSSLRVSLWRDVALLAVIVTALWSSAKKTK